MPRKTATAITVSQVHQGIKPGTRGSAPFVSLNLRRTPDPSEKPFFRSCLFVQCECA
jgi:hypothetical protein